MVVWSEKVSSGLTVTERVQAESHPVTRLGVVPDCVPASVNSCPWKV